MSCFKILLISRSISEVCHYKLPFPFRSSTLQLNQSKKKKKKFNQPVADFVYEPVIDFEVHMNFIFHKLYHSVKFRIRSIIIRSSIIYFCFICYISACPYVALCSTEYACLWRQKRFLSATEHHYVSLSMLCNPHVFLC